MLSNLAQGGGFCPGRELPREVIKVPGIFSWKGNLEGIPGDGILPGEVRSVGFGVSIPFRPGTRKWLLVGMLLTIPLFGRIE